MRKQNRNNRICTNEESGKTDFIIDPLLPIGKENAITTQELMRISGCGSSRELRQRIALERERGAIPNDDLIVRIPENEAEGELWSYEM